MLDIQVPPISKSQSPVLNKWLDCQVLNAERCLVPWQTGACRSAPGYEAMGMADYSVLESH